MNDVRSLLSETVPPDLRTPHRWEDTQADLARGRTLLARRRRRLALAGGTGLAAAGAAGTLLLTGPVNRPAPVASPAPGKVSVALVAYAGAQPKGYTLRAIPKGWEVASADNTNLVLHKIGTPKTGTSRTRSSSRVTSTRSRQRATRPYGSTAPRAGSSATGAGATR